MALVRLDFDLAIRLNPPGLVFVGIFCLWWVSSIYETVTRRRTWLHDWTTRKLNMLIIIGIAVLFLFGTLRIVALIYG